MSSYSRRILDCQLLLVDVFDSVRKWQLNVSNEMAWERAKFLLQKISVQLKTRTLLVSGDGNFEASINCNVQMVDVFRNVLRPSHQNNADMDMRDRWMKALCNNSDQLESTLLDIQRRVMMVFKAYLELYQQATESEMDDIRSNKDHAMRRVEDAERLEGEEKRRTEGAERRVAAIQGELRVSQAQAQHTLDMSELRLAAAKLRNDSHRKNVVEAEEKCQMAEGRLSDKQVAVRRLLKMRASHLA